KQKIMDWITPLNFFQRQADILTAWQPGTGQWLLSDACFKCWESKGQQVIWCHGMPGAGKTILSAMVVNYLQAKFQGDSNVACIYLNHKETAAQTLVNLLASIWKQLAVDKPLDPAMQTLYKHHRARDTSLSVQEISNILCMLIVQQPQVYLIVDALDEYPEQQRIALLEQLATLLGPTARLMITSRPNLKFHDFFPNLLVVEIRASNDDICCYIDKQIHLAPRLSKHVQLQPRLCDEIKSCITSKVDGM
ncbi:hypothetical protein B0H15DRAFT_793167, partial [Mycena belliarum]